MNWIKYTIIGLVLPSFLTAQDKTEIRADSVLQEVMVTATKQKAALLNIPYSVNTLNAKTINEYQYRTAPEALTASTGVFIQKTNHGGGSPFVRGLTGNQSLLMVDGIRMNNSTFRYGPNQYFNTIDVYNIGAIEVARGTGSVQYGSDAMGGVIQVFTKEPAFAKQAKWFANLYGKAVSSDIEYSGRVETGYQSKKIAFRVGFSARNFGDLLGGDTTGKQVPSGYREQAFDAKLKWQVFNKAILTLSHQQLSQTDVPLYHRVRLENFAYYKFDPQQRILDYAKLDIEGSKKLLSRISFTASVQHGKEVREYMRNGNANRFNETDKVRTTGLTADIFSEINTVWTANSGVEYYHDKVNSNKEQITIANGNKVTQRGLYPDNATMGNFSLYSLHHFNFQQFGIEAGLRYNGLAIDITDTATTTVNLGAVKVRPSSLVSNISFLYKLTNNQSIYTSFSTGYRAPNIDDMGTLGLVDFRYEVPAYNLKPEQSYNTEIGYRFVGKRAKASVALYYMHLSNIVNRVQVAGQQIGGYNVYIKENNQESFIRGFEYEFSYQFSKSFSVETGGAYAYGQNTSRNEPMRRIPPFNGRFLLKYAAKGFFVQLEQLYASKQSRLAQGDKDDNRIPVGGTPGWYLINIYGGYQLKNWSVRSGFMNILNEDYRMHGSGINGAGRSLYIGLGVSL